MVCLKGRRMHNPPQNQLADGLKTVSKIKPDIKSVVQKPRHLPRFEYR